MAARLTAYVVVAIVSATLIAGLIVGAQREDNDGPVDLIVRNASVYSADRHGTMAEAVAIRGNQILRVGSDRDIARLQRPQTVVVDARGGTVLPGFNDAHLSLIRGGLALGSVDLSDAQNVSDVLDRIGAWSEANPSAGWIIGRGWAPHHFKNGLPTRQLLDAVVADRPAFLTAVDQSTAWVNSRALRLAGITRKTPDPDDGAIVRESRRGEPSGVLTGRAGELVAKLIPPPSREQRLAALRAAVAEANALGITSVQNAEDTLDDFDLYDALRRGGDLTLRVYAALRLEQPLRDDDIARLDGTLKKFPDDPIFKSGAVSIALDGPVATHDAAMLEPFENSTQSGMSSFAPDDLNRTVRLADAAGWQIITHATGDRAVRMALTAYAHAARSNRPPSRGRRHRIENIAIVDPADVPRFGPLGVVASMQPSRSVPTDERIESLSGHLGAERAGRSFAFRSVAEQTRIIFGSAWPSEDLNPLLGLHVAVNQTTPEGTPEDGWHPEERLQLKPAIDAYTSAAAWASFDDQRKGSISPGMLADIVVLSDDIFAAPAEKLASVSIAVTIFDGKVVYRRVPRSETEPVPSLQH